MRRCLAALLVVGVCSIQVDASLLHVHAYFDHDHNEHRHGPAIHAHDSDHHQGDPTPRLSECDPSQHVMTASLAALETPDARELVAERVPSESLPALPQRSARMRLPDVHSHGPPVCFLRLLRGPPL